MNIRKNIDYSDMYNALDKLMSQQLPQMELYCEIGKTVCRRTGKGAAVMASEYLSKQYPDVKGFSPRSLRRMRDFYRTYENHPALLSRAMKLGWIQNVVIMEAELTMELREWYMKAAKQFGWSKTELTTHIAAKVHEEIVLTDDRNNDNMKKVKVENDLSVKEIDSRYVLTLRAIRLVKSQWLLKKDGRRRWLTRWTGNLTKVECFQTIYRKINLHLFS